MASYYKRHCRSQQEPLLAALQNETGGAEQIVFCRFYRGHRYIRQGLEILHFESDLVIRYGEVWDGDICIYGDLGGWDKTCCFVTPEVDIVKVATFYKNQIYLCPLCGSGGVSEDIGLSAFWDLAKTLDLIKSGRFHVKPVVYRRCFGCKTAGLSYRDKWVEARRNKSPLAKICDLIYPKDKIDSRAVKKAIIRRVNKVRRVRPLSLAERVFFQMHLGASKLKQIARGR